MVGIKLGPWIRIKDKIEMGSGKYLLVSTLLCWLSTASLVTATAQDRPFRQKEDKMEINQRQLDEVRQWLWRNPPNGKNRVERRQRMAVIQAACDSLPPAIYEDYVSCWTKDPTQADSLENQYPGLYYLRKATRFALADIQKTNVEKGMAIWYLYNMGYVFKTPDACFGIDVKTRDSEKLANVLDFLLITHEHHDHYSSALIDAMIKAGKPVITRWREGTTIVSAPREFTFGACRVKVDIGDHHQPRTQNDMLMFQVDCGESANHRTIYHSGDCNNYQKMIPDKKVDVFIVHVQVGMSVKDAITHLKPRLTFVSHALELGHNTEPPNAWRWSFDYAFRQIKGIPESQATTLTWGERYLTPGTLLADGI